jgi:hypothetical protein
MKKSTLYYIWLGAFMLCFLLSLIPKPSGPLRVAMTIFSLGLPSEAAAQDFMERLEKKYQ